MHNDYFPFLYRYFTDALAIVKRYFNIVWQFFKGDSLIFLRSFLWIISLVLAMFFFSYTTIFDTLSVCLSVSFPRRNLGDPFSRVVIRYSLNWLYEFYNVISLWRREIVKESIFSDFFKYRQTSMLGYLVDTFHSSESNLCILLSSNYVYSYIHKVQTSKKTFE